MNDFDCIIGVDPGSNGGITVWRPNAHVTAHKMPKDLSELRGFFQYLKEISNKQIVFLEKVQLRPDDVTGNPGKAFRIQQLLMAFQQLKDYIAVEGIPYVLVHPMSWQSYLNLVKRGEEKKDRKNRYKRAAQRCYPEVKVTLWNADALLLMHFGRKKLREEPEWVAQNLPSEIKKKIDLFND